MGAIKFRTNQYYPTPFPIPHGRDLAGNDPWWNPATLRRTVASQTLLPFHLAIFVRCYKIILPDYSARGRIIDVTVNFAMRAHNAKLSIKKDREQKLTRKKDAMAVTLLVLVLVAVKTANSAPLSSSNGE